MNLFDNGLVQLEYDTSLDVLFATCPDIEELALLQIHVSFKAIAATITKHGIRKLLLDCSNTVIDVDDEDYGVVLSHFMEELTRIPLLQFARIAINFAFHNFTDRAAAIHWLFYRCPSR